MRQVNISEFKAKCLSILDQVAKLGEGVTILKHGKTIAQVVPPTPRDEGYPQRSLKGTVEILGDILEPALPAGEWEAERA